MRKCYRLLKESWASDGSDGQAASRADAGMQPDCRGASYLRRGRDVGSRASLFGHTTQVAGSLRGIAPPELPQIRTCTFVHTAPHVAGSLSLTRSSDLSGTRLEVRCPRRGSGLWSTTRRPLRSTGSGRARSPASTLIWDAPTPVRPSRRASLSPGDTTRAPCLLPAAGTLGRGLRGVGIPGPEPENVGGDERVSQVPGNP
jgi:hypothetical protein